MTDQFEYGREITKGSVSKADAAYITAGKWRCPKSPTGAHESAYNAKGQGTCRWCGAKR